MADFIVVGVVVLILGGILLNYIKKKKEGKSMGCGSCSGCSSSSCHSMGREGSHS